jgi:hypothetical protein
MKKVLVAISHPGVATGVCELLRLARGMTARRTAPDAAADVALEWSADLIVVDAPVPHRLPSELRPRMLIAAAGDGAIARDTAARLGSSWMFVDELARELPRLTRGAR